MNIDQMVDHAIKTDKWAILYKNKASSPVNEHKGKIGQWESACLHRVQNKTIGANLRDDLVFCEIKEVPADNGRAHITEIRQLLVNQLPALFDFKGWIILHDCDLRGVTFPRSVSCSLDLRDCDLRGVVLPQIVEGSLDLMGCDTRGITLPRSVGGWLNLFGCDLGGPTVPLVGGVLDLTGCNTIPGDLKIFKR
jgi:uncharacterized protein YjbI with pentapeptide repeats